MTYRRELLCRNDRMTDRQELLCRNDRMTDRRELLCRNDRMTDRRELLCRNDRMTDRRELFAGMTEWKGAFIPNDRMTDRRELLCRNDRMTDRRELLCRNDRMTDRRELLYRNERMADRQELLYRNDRMADRQELLYRNDRYSADSKPNQTSTYGIYAGNWADKSVAQNVLRLIGEEDTYVSNGLYEDVRPKSTHISRMIYRMSYYFIIFNAGICRGNGNGKSVARNRRGGGEHAKPPKGDVLGKRQASVEVDSDGDTIAEEFPAKSAWLGRIA
ncbi:hypothetical protein CEXT_634511 [Caerostris extrusa]|uniref:Uncharacterized protein n=1 Tax=Caerostris extrusa TaxID=172846 RepID=A0AAV4RC95_CAEEX|nr:hypothetical protein CEXT_634511 [Caerostris extrusa]